MDDQLIPYLIVALALALLGVCCWPYQQRK